MMVYLYIFIGYIIVANIITFIIYYKEAKKPSLRIAPLLMILLPIIGGAFGATLANYIFDTEYRELRSWLHKYIAYLPPVMVFIHLFLFILVVGIDNSIGFIWNHIFSNEGIIGILFLVINVITFFLIVIRKTAYYIAPSGCNIIPDFILIPFLLLGGSIGGVFAKIVFNFKENWSHHANMVFQNLALR